MGTCYCGQGRDWDEHHLCASYPSPKPRPVDRAEEERIRKAREERYGDIKISPGDFGSR